MGGHNCRRFSTPRRFDCPNVEAAIRSGFSGRSLGRDRCSDGRTELLVATIIVLMLTGGQTLEEYATQRASSALNALAHRMPNVAHRIDNKSTSGIPVSEIQIGDRLIVFPHEICPVDGTVESGTGTKDESFLTETGTCLQNRVLKSIANDSLTPLSDGAVVARDAKAVSSHLPPVGPRQKYSAFDHRFGLTASRHQRTRQTKTDGTFSSGSPPQPQRGSTCPSTRRIAPAPFEWSVSSQVLSAI